MRAITSWLTTPGESPRLRWALLALLIFVPFFLSAAKEHHRKLNTDYYTTDQKVYLSTAMEIHDRGLDYVSPRFRTTGISYVLAPFYDHKWDPPANEPISKAWFHYAKDWFVVLTVICLIVFGIASAFWFRSALPAVVVITAFVWLIGVFRAGYTQPEFLYWALQTVAVLFLWRCLEKPSIGSALAGGILAAAAFLTKSGSLPLIALFVACFGFKILWDWFILKSGWSWRSIAIGVLVPVSFCVTLAPYIATNLRIYGSPFYSTYSKYHFWGEKRATGQLTTKGNPKFNHKAEMEAIRRTRAHQEPLSEEEFTRQFNIALADIEGRPVPAPEQFVESPSRARYFKHHTLGDAMKRVMSGLSDVRSKVDKHYLHARRFLHRTLILCAILAIALPLFRRIGWLDPGGLDFRQKVPVLLFLAGFFAGYLVLYGWFNELRIGPRLVLPLYFPALIVGLTFLDRLAPRVSMPLRSGRRLYFLKLAPLVLLVLAAIYSRQVVTDHLFRDYMYSGG